MNIIDFVNGMNKYTPTCEEVCKLGDIDLDIAKEICESFHFSYFPSSQKIFENKIEELFICTNIAYKSIGDIVMCGEIEINHYEGFRVFANYDETSPIFFKKDKREIYCADFSREDSFSICANNDEKFIYGLMQYGIIWLNNKFRGEKIILENIKQFDDIPVYNNLFVNLLYPQTLE